MTIKNRVLLCCLVLSSMALTAQERVTSSIHSKVPTSIFTEQLKLPPIGSYQESISETLELKNFKFLFVDQESIRNGNFHVDLRNIGRSASVFTYESYRDVDLYKHFPRIYDLRDIPWKQL